MIQITKYPWVCNLATYRMSVTDEEYERCLDNIYVYIVNIYSINQSVSNLLTRDKMILVTQILSTKVSSSSEPTGFHPQNFTLNEMTKITTSNQSHKSYRKCKSENGRTRTSEFIRGGIRCHGGASIPC
jgi:hypothetical protein